MAKGNGLVVVETHPVQYHAPVYRELQRAHGIPVTAVYGSDFSVAGYRDREFGASFAWDTDLLSGYTPRFLARAAQGGAASFEAASARGRHAWGDPFLRQARHGRSCRPVRAVWTGGRGPAAAKSPFVARLAA